MAPTKANSKKFICPLKRKQEESMTTNGNILEDNELAISLIFSFFWAFHFLFLVQIGSGIKRS